VPGPFRDPKSGSYYVSFSYQGRRHKRSIGSGNLSAARRTQSIIDGKVQQLKARLVEVPEGITVPDFVFDGKTEPDLPDARTPLALTTFIDQFLEETAPPNKAESTYETEKIHASHLQEFAQKKNVETVDEADRGVFEAYKHWRHRQGRKNSTINREMNTFRTMFSLAVRAGWLEENPFDNVKWLKDDASLIRFRTGAEIQQMIDSGHYTPEEIAEARRYRYLNQEEVARLLVLAENSEIHAFAGTAAYTGMRFSEVRRLKWSDVDLDSNQILARGYKGSKQQVESPRRIPLHSNLVKILKEHAQKASGSWLFTDQDGNPRPSHYYYWRLQKLTDGTEFEGVRFRTLRHSFASNLAIQGVDQRIIDRWMGHHTEAMRERYQHLFPDQQQEAIEKLGF